MVNKKSVKYLISLSIFLLIIGLQSLSACEIEFHVDGEQKKTYKNGDTIIVKVKVIFTHRVCPEGIDNTKFTYNGLKVLGATKWVETFPGTWKRKLKIQFTETGDSLKLKAVRTCDKDGGSGSITFKAT